MLTDIVLILAWALVGLVVMVQTFRWGYNKEKAGRRTDFMGRPNNHMKK